jgi:hypothetical protein
MKDTMTQKLEFSEEIMVVLMIQLSRVFREWWLACVREVDPYDDGI